MSQTIELKSINRFWITLAVVASVGIGTAPLMVLINQPKGWLIINLSSLLVAAITLAFNRRTTYHRPNPGEYLLSGFSTTFLAATFGVMGMVFYYLLFAVIRGIEWLVQLVLVVEWDQARLAYIITMVFAIPLYWLIAWSFADDISEYLSPETAGLRSPFYYLLTVHRSYVRKILTWDLVALVALILGGFFWFADWVTLILLQLFLVIGTSFFEIEAINTRIEESSITKQEKERTGSQLGATFQKILDPGKQSAEFSRKERYITGVIQLFKATGWYVEMNPRMKDPAIDPLLVDIDLLVTRNGVNMLVDVSYTKDKAIFKDINRPSVIIQAVWLLAEQRGLDPKNVVASLILIDAEPEKMIYDICKRMGINLLTLESDLINKFLNIPESDMADRTQMAKRILPL